MRLLNAKSLEFESFEEDNAPDYAILSHTWGDDEVTYKEMTKRKYRAQAEKKAGYEKIRQCAALSVKEGLSYFWIDTCCIDKSSSAELSEAINSMFRWYQNAKICFAHLADVPPRFISQKKPGEVYGLWFDIGTEDKARQRQESEQKWLSAFQSSRWFSRGWTLQELIAPKTLVFLSSEWVRVGDKESLRSQITARTKISSHVLLTGEIETACLAQRMSWASSRVTSRQEDMAYCLMGLCEVNMPLLYGEGKRAFIRLQEEIIKRSDDMSIFAWTDPEAHFSCYRGLFAESPKNFAPCHDMEWTRPERSSPFDLTNKGVKLQAEVGKRQKALLHGPATATEGDELFLRLPGISLPYWENKAIGIYVQKIGEDDYARVDVTTLTTLQESIRLIPDQTVFIRQNPTMQIANHARAAGIRVNVVGVTLDLTSVEPAGAWNNNERFFKFPFPPSANLRLIPRFTFHHLLAGESFQKRASRDLFILSNGGSEEILDDSSIIGVARQLRP